jgi:hypothetical protein
MNNEADGGTAMVGDAGSLIGGEFGVCIPGGEEGEASSGEEGLDAGGESEGDVLFEDAVRELGSGVGAAVGGVEEDKASVDGWLRLRWDWNGDLRLRRGLRGLGVSREAGDYAQGQGHGFRGLAVPLGHYV